MTTGERVIALDVGGTAVKSALVAPGVVIAAEHMTTAIDSAADADSILTTLAAIIRRHLARVDGPELRGVALGFPGPFDYEAGVSRIRGVAKYESLYGLNIRDAIRERLGRKELLILFRNDAEAAIVGEARYGAGRPYRRIIGITLGTGCGSAFLVHGEPVRGGDGVPPNGWLYPLPFEGRQADDVFSARGLAARLRLAGVGVGIVEAATLARAGNRTALEAFACFGQDLAAFLHPVALAFRADAILVLGGIANTFDLFGAALGHGLPVPVLQGQLGPDAALLGAAALFFEG